MSYKHKNSVLNDIERLDTGMYFTGEDGIHNSEDKVYELKDVYAKAEAFDEVIKINKNCWNVYDFDRNIRDVIGTYESEAE